jgi:hypothetical protein
VKVRRTRFAFALASLLAGSVGMVQAAKLTGQSFEAAKQHWAFQPIQHPAPPRIKSAGQVQTPIDVFLLAKLETKGLTFAPPADSRTLLRRVYYDLIGLPPTTEEVEAFSQLAMGNRQSAIATVVDRLLADPRYGERWGRHWLDVARYADTKDLVLLYGTDAIRPYAYTYRDYVIRAFNDDVPFDEFVRDQLAADLVEPKLPPWRLGALGFLTLGRLFDNNPHDQIDDQIDTVSRGLLGLTVACARCHDHKYDAIKSADYYGLYGVFASTERPYVLPLIEDPAKVPGGLEFEEKLAKAHKELEDHLDGAFAALTESFRQRIGDYLVRAVTTPPDITETTQFGLSLTPDDFRPGVMQRTRRFVEARAKPDDRVFGPWAKLMALPDEAFAEKAKLLLASLEPVCGCVGGDGTEDPKAGPTGTDSPSPGTPNALVVAALIKSAPTNKTGVARAYGNLLRDTYDVSKKPGTPRLSEDQRELLAIVTGQDGPIWFARRDTPIHLSRPDADKHGGLAQGLDKLAAHATKAPPARAMVVAELPEPYEPRIFTRGSPARPGERVPRGFLRVLNGGHEQPFGAGSGRLDLARAITSPTNPLTARVFVNRVWMEHFGEPLVSSPSDFGVRSERPTHPELLDWLASEFIRSGWSVKHLHRVILTSAAFAQSSSDQYSVISRSVISGPVSNGSRRLNTDPLITDHSSHLAADPDNHLLSHYPRRRLDLEAMRDTLLFVAGRMDDAIGGRPVDVAGDPLNQRRTVYGLVDRQNLPGLFRSFDFAVPDQCVERRPKTTVPQQALFAMNSPFVMEQSRALAALPEIAGQSDMPRRVAALFRRVLGRNPAPHETAQALRFIGSAGADTSAQQPAWEQFAQVLLASNELVFLD